MTNEKTKYMDDLAKFVIGEEMKIKRTKGEKYKTNPLGVGHLSDEAKGFSVKEGKREYASGTISKANNRLEELNSKINDIQAEIRESVEEMKQSPEPEDKNLANEGDAIQRTLNGILQWLEKKHARQQAEKELVGLGWKARQAVKKASGVSGETKEVLVALIQMIDDYTPNLSNSELRYLVDLMLNHRHSLESAQSRINEHKDRVRENPSVSIPFEINRR